MTAREGERLQGIDQQRREPLEQLARHVAATVVVPGLEEPDGAQVRVTLEPGRAVGEPAHLIPPGAFGST